ncbi:hypothetical protein MCP1_170081 [Candidatus Terasakiella magnetica]|nr:hypothetical protein MCP1_170081 [Candidatus Terasakiella magnetica]
MPPSDWGPSSREVKRNRLPPRAWICFNQIQPPGCPTIFLLTANANPDPLMGIADINVREDTKIGSHIIIPPFQAQ